MTQLTDEQIERVRASYGRAMSDPALIPRFYETLLAASPEAREKFQRTDWNSQHEALRQSISMALLFPRGNVVARQAMERLRQAHDRHHMDIRPELYDVWVDSLMIALREIDDAFDDQLEREWRALLAVTVAYLEDGY